MLPINQSHQTSFPSYRTERITRRQLMRRRTKKIQKLRKMGFSRLWRSTSKYMQLTIQLSWSSTHARCARYGVQRVRRAFCGHFARFAVIFISWTTTYATSCSRLPESICYVSDIPVRGTFLFNIGYLFLHFGRWGYTNVKSALRAIALILYQHIRHHTPQ